MTQILLIAAFFLLSIQANAERLPALKPGESVTVSLPGAEKEFRILRASGFEVFKHTLK